VVGGDQSELHVTIILLGARLFALAR
jgi:hypothetical protein